MKNGNFRRRQNGLTLVEIMVAMVAALILVGGAFQVYLSSKRTYRAQESLARLQESGRFTAMQLTDELRMAGFSGCISDVNNLLNPSGTGYSDAFFDVTRPVFGWDAAGTAPGDNYAVAGFDPAGVALSQWNDSAGNDLAAILQDLVIPGTDVIVVRRAERRVGATADGNTPANASSITLTGQSGIERGRIVLVTDCAGADLFQNVNNQNSTALNRAAGVVQPGNRPPGGNPFSHQYGPDMEIYTFAVDAYYVGLNCSGVPGLFRMRFSKGMPVRNNGNCPVAGEVEELVEGVDNIQWLYGEDTNADRAVDRYVAASAVSDWQRVIAVRGAMLVSGGNSALDESRTTAFSVNGTSITPPDDRRQRQLFTTTIALRNRLP